MRRMVLLSAGVAALLVSRGVAAPSPADAPATPANDPVHQAPALQPLITPVPEDYFQRYGKILAPGTEPSHPLKLAMPAPDVGQIKIPSPEELAMRDKLERLTTMSNADILKDLEAWPAFGEMTLGDQGAMLSRIQLFKDRRAKIAQERAHTLGLLTLKPDQMQRFETEYWDKRMQLDTELARQFSPVYKARENKLEEDLFREFSTPTSPVPPPAHPPAPALASAPKPDPMTPPAR